MRILKPLVLSLGLVAAGGAADAQQSAQDSFAQQVEAAAARAQAPEAQAMQKQVEEAVSKARADSGAPAQPEQSAASATPAAAGGQSSAQVTQVPKTSGGSGYGGGGAGPSAPTAATEPSSPMSGAASAASAGTTGTGASAPFAHEYFARVDQAARLLRQGGLAKPEKLELRGAIQDDTSHDPVDVELAQELRRLEQESRTGARLAAKPAGRTRLPFTEPTAQKIASGARAHRVHTAVFEELN